MNLHNLGKDGYDTFTVTLKVGVPVCDSDGVPKKGWRVSGHSTLLGGSGGHCSPSGRGLHFQSVLMSDIPERRWVQDLVMSRGCRSC